MNIVDSSLEDIGDGQFRLIVTFRANDGKVKSFLTPLGSGPSATGAVPDRIVNALIQTPSHSLTLAEIHNLVDGNPGTISRQSLDFGHERS